MAAGMETPPSAVRPVASLTPTLLARKGSAKPAMRPQLGDAGLSPVHGAGNEPGMDDLGWNDLGEDLAPPPSARVVAFPREVRRKPKSRRAPGAALEQGGKAAFTLRLDAERHLKLRLACTLDSCSAQALVTDALDRLLAQIPDLDVLAGQVVRRRKS